MDNLSTVIRHLTLLNEDHPHPTLVQSIARLERILAEQNRIADEILAEES